MKGKMKKISVFLVILIFVVGTASFAMANGFDGNGLPGDDEFQGEGQRELEAGGEDGFRILEEFDMGNGCSMVTVEITTLGQRKVVTLSTCPQACLGNMQEAQEFDGWAQSPGNEIFPDQIRPLIDELAGQEGELFVCKHAEGMCNELEERLGVNEGAQEWNPRLGANPWQMAGGNNQPCQGANCHRPNNPEPPQMGAGGADHPENDPKPDDLERFNSDGKACFEGACHDVKHETPPKSESDQALSLAGRAVAIKEGEARKLQQEIDRLAVQDLLGNTQNNKEILEKLRSRLRELNEGIKSLKKILNGPSASTWTVKQKVTIPGGPGTTYEIYTTEDFILRNPFHKPTEEEMRMLLENYRKNRNRKQCAPEDPNCLDPEVQEMFDELLDWIDEMMNRDPAFVDEVERLFGNLAPLVLIGPDGPEFPEANLGRAPACFIAMGNEAMPNPENLPQCPENRCPDDLQRINANNGQMCGGAFNNNWMDRFLGVHGIAAVCLDWNDAAGPGVGQNGGGDNPNG